MALIAAGRWLPLLMRGGRRKFHYQDCARGTKLGPLALEICGAEFGMCDCFKIERATVASRECAQSGPSISLCPHNSVVIIICACHTCALLPMYYVVHHLHSLASENLDICILVQLFVGLKL